ncbi:bis(5'-nucleosyl)-tetraphosphatase (symmetrical) YqeK [Terrisporobacter sp.]
MKYEQMKEKLKEMLPERRLQHSFNVSKCAVELSKIYGCDENKAKIAGLLHDCAKYFTDEQVEDCIKKFNIKLDHLEENNIALSHSVIGSYIVKEVFNVEDKEITDAIKYHTTGKENMSLLEKVIYIADLIEEDRNFSGVKELRDLTYEGKLEEALLMSFNNTIKFVIDNNQLIHSRTVKARNYILSKSM